MRRNDTERTARWFCPQQGRRTRPGARPLGFLASERFLRFARLMSGLVAEAVAPAPAAAVAAPPPAVALAAAAAPAAHAAAPAAYDAAAAAAAAHGLGVQDLTWLDLFSFKLSEFNPFDVCYASTGITGQYIDNIVCQ